ncbi:AAA domain-containing protein [Vibrio furnissii]|uniref:AAA domain-containing protein n=2 Tax=Vibrio TaxID=662 RepID=UPI001C9BBFB2|nr:AAA domain-containing protein [Vibrio furnissii]MBY8100746.1 AAA family ATPase [Vibrio fluvialis]MCG6233028.1 AAA domain-containing protein [Vibrio furnissii]MCG6258875.1 AAA domain-containing protein [Vibrio furnissii]
MIHFAVAGAVILGASAVAWYYDQKTDEELKRQERAYRDRDNITRKYTSAYQDSQNDFRYRQAEQAREYKALLLRELDTHYEKIEPIVSAYESLFEVIFSEINADTTSPYRKSALKKEYSKLEDAKLRIFEYKNYLDFERKKINQLWGKESYGGLMERDIPDALLPLEWLYPGKLLLVSMEDLNQPLEKTRHILQYSGFDGEKDKQQSLALRYGDEFPMLVVSKGKGNRFYGCVARGIAFYEYIRLFQPMDMIVDHFISSSKQYRCTFGDGLVSVNLPQQNLEHASLKCIPGQKVSVYFDSFNATLSQDPIGRPLKNGRMPLPTVTEKSPSTLGYDELELYVLIDNQQLDNIPKESSFFDETSNWSFLSYDFDTNEVSLAKGTVELTCIVSEKNDGLVVKYVFNHQQTQIGIDLRFDFILLTPDLDASELFGWEYGVEQFLNFISQIAVNSTTAQERTKQVEFFQRWKHVVEYQKKQESVRSIEFDFTPQILDSSRKKFQLKLPKSVVDSQSNSDNSVYSFMKDIECSGYLTFSRSCRLTVWDHAQSKFISAVKRKDADKVNFELTDDGIDIEAHLFDYDKIDLTASNRFRLTVSLPNPALQRQQQALDSFFEDRLVSPMLKEIFLSPSNYEPEFLSQWRSNEILWSGNLTESQKHAVKTALSAKTIAMIQGPPGTGKTTTIVEMLYQLLTENPNQKILVVSQQNTAVDNAISKFKSKYPELITNDINIVRVGNSDKVDDSVLDNHLDSVYDDFISDCFADSLRNISNLTESEYNALCEWRALLSQVKDRGKEVNVSDEFFTSMLSSRNLIGATCVGLAARKAGIDYLTFDVAIIDEAGRATVPELLIPLLRSRKAVLIGDHHQLPPSIAPVLREDAAKQEMSFLEETFLESSFFEVLFEQLSPDCKATLSEQFRMSDPIGDLVANLFYSKDGRRQLINGSVKPLTSDFVFNDCVSWVDVRGKQKKPNGSTSIENELEAKSIYSFLLDISNKTTRAIDVAVITPYGAQKRLIRSLFKPYGKGQTIQVGTLSIKVDTVDSFQGSEAELVCYSTVRSHGTLKFLLDKKRLNVACSRAKENLVFFGHKKHMTKKHYGEQNLFVDISKQASNYVWKENTIEKCIVSS